MFITPSSKDIRKFNRDGFIIFENCINSNNLSLIETCCQDIINNHSKYTVFDWAGRKKSTNIKKFNIIQASATKYFPELLTTSFYHWIRFIGCILMRQPIDFWFDQFLVKPPQLANATPWHQDEAYWGRALANKAITCWVPLQDVDVDNGCLCYIKGYHHKTIIKHYHPKKIKSDLLACKIPNAEITPCPIKKGSVVFHHCRTPHMATRNKKQQWRKALSIHLKNPHVPGEGELYPWRIYVNQRANETVKPTSDKPHTEAYF